MAYMPDVAIKLVDEDRELMERFIKAVDEAKQLPVYSVKRLHLQPGEKLIVYSDEVMNGAQVQRLHAQVQAHFPGAEVLICSKDVGLEIFTPGN